MINTFFSLRIKEIRENNGLKQKDLAHILNLSKATISSYENGTRMASLDTLVKISCLFNININYLIGIDCLLINEKGTISNMSNEEYEIIKELRKYNKLHKLFIKYPKKIINRVNKIFF